MKEKTADEMFEKLGYKKRNLDIIFSRFLEEWENEDLAKTFSFNTEYKTIVVDDDMDNGWVVPIIETKETIKNYFKHHLYLSTHTFYWSSREYYTKKLQEFGFNIKLIG